MKKATRLYLVRHGQVLGHEDFPVYGHTDAELTEVGYLQMEHLAERLRLAQIQAVYSSDLKRSLHGARLIARFHDVLIHPVPEIREIYFGTWEGCSFKDLRERFPEELSRREADLVHFKPPGGESIGELAERVRPCLKEIRDRHAEKNILIVGHGAVNRVILCDALGLDLTRMFSLQQNYGCLNIVDYFMDRTLVRLVNG